VYLAKAALLAAEPRLDEDAGAVVVGAADVGEEVVLAAAPPQAVAAAATAARGRTIFKTLREFGRIRITYAVELSDLKWLLSGDKSLLRTAHYRFSLSHLTAYSQESRLEVVCFCSP
jgi:hypothetical protein